MDDNRQLRNHYKISEGSVVRVHITMRILVKYKQDEKTEKQESFCFDVATGTVRELREKVAKSFRLGGSPFDLLARTSKKDKNKHNAILFHLFSFY